MTVDGFLEICFGLVPANGRIEIVAQQEIPENLGRRFVMQYYYQHLVY